MVYPSNRDYPPAAQPGTWARRRGGVDERVLPATSIAVALLGLASYGTSFALAAHGLRSAGWPVRFAALAALCIAVGELPPDKTFRRLIAVLAAMGFLDGLWQVVAAPSGWPLTAIVVLGGLQAAAAVATLLLAPRADAPDATVSAYQAYLDHYTQALRQYSSQQPAAPFAYTRHESAWGSVDSRSQAAAGGRPPGHARFGNVGRGVSGSADHGSADVDDRPHGNADSAVANAGDGYAGAGEGTARYGQSGYGSGSYDDYAERRDPGSSAWPAAGDYGPSSSPGDAAARAGLPTANAAPSAPGPAPQDPREAVYRAPEPPGRLESGRPDDG